MERQVLSCWSRRYNVIMLSSGLLPLGQKKVAVVVAGVQVPAAVDDVQSSPPSLYCYIFVSLAHV